MADSSPLNLLFEQSREFRKNPTQAEAILWEHLRNRKSGNYKFRRQHPVGKYILDFYCAEARIGIEVDGGIHQEPEQSLHDIQRSLDLAELGIEIIRFWNSDITNNCDEALQQIKICIEHKIKH